MDPNVPEQERAKALEFCNQYLDGVWKALDESSTIVCKVSGGMSNLLYYCALNESTEVQNQEPREVLLRLYGPNMSDVEVQLEIFNQLAAEKLGPNLLARFDGGRIEQYLPSNALSWNQLVDPNTSRVIARKIACINSLEFKSLERSNNWLINQFRQLNQLNAKAKATTNVVISPDAPASTRSIAEEITQVDFDAEIQFLTELLEESEAPLVFSHNDLHQNNIILMHATKDNIPLDDRVILIDFEYCSYNYRTFDIANHLAEWCFDYTGSKYPFFNASADRMPSEQKQREFLAHYLEQLSDIKPDPLGLGLSFEDSVDFLYYEMQPFLMASNFLWSIWAIKGGYTSKINFGYWEMAKHKWDIYLLCKEQWFQSARDAIKLILEQDKQLELEHTNSQHTNIDEARSS